MVDRDESSVFCELQSSSEEKINATFIHIGFAVMHASERLGLAERQDGRNERAKYLTVTDD